MGYVDKLGTKGKTPWMTLSSRLYTDTKDNPLSRFVRIGYWPVLFGLKGKHDPADPAVVSLEEVCDVSNEGAVASYKEKDLHPFLAYFAHAYMGGVYVKTISHEKSQKKSYAEWVHPDLVGVLFAFPELDQDVNGLADSVGATPLKLLSFELKTKLGFSNLREAFFQAVSNSSWANRGYLVAAEIDSSGEFREELARLSKSFGIGVIKLSVDSPDDSEIMFAAREREDLDWMTINKLAKINQDFRQFIKDVRIDVQGKRVHPSEYDEIAENADDLKIKHNNKQKK